MRGFRFYRDFLIYINMESFKDCSTHKENVDLLILEKIHEGEDDNYQFISITTNNDADINVIWLKKEDALKLAYSIIELAK